MFAIMFYQLTSLYKKIPLKSCNLRGFPLNSVGTVI
jgi:hypothetical protein